MAGLHLRIFLDPVDAGLATPVPDCLKPPIGISGPPAMVELIQIRPACTRRMLADALSMSFVQMEAARP